MDATSKAATSKASKTFKNAHHTASTRIAISCPKLGKPGMKHPVGLQPQHEVPTYGFYFCPSTSGVPRREFQLHDLLDLAIISPVLASLLQALIITLLP